MNDVFIPIKNAEEVVKYSSKYGSIGLLLKTGTGIAIRHHYSASDGFGYRFINGVSLEDTGVNYENVNTFSNLTAAFLIGVNPIGSSMLNGSSILYQYDVMFRNIETIKKEIEIIKNASLGKYEFITNVNKTERRSTALRIVQAGLYANVFTQTHPAAFFVNSKKISVFKVDGNTIVALSEIEAVILKGEGDDTAQG